MPDATEELNLSITIGAASFTGDGPADRVMAALERFSELVAGHSTGTPPPDDSSGASEASPPPPKQNAGRQANGDAGEKVPFATFMKRQFPNQAATAAAIFTWAKRYDGKETLKPGDLQTYWKKILKKPGNPTQVCLTAQKKGWLESVGGGAYAVIGHGETMVDKLPPATDNQ